MARAALNMTLAALSEAARVAPNTISRFEAEKTTPIPATLSVIRAALESAGVEFISENGGGPGVRLRKAGDNA